MLAVSKERLRPGLIVAGFVLLTLAWVFASAPYQAPDEQAHYLRAAAIASGTLLGPTGFSRGSTEAQTAWLTSHTRRESIDARLIPPTFRCKPVPASHRCVTSNYAGNYQPLPYLLPAVAARAAITLVDNAHFANRSRRALFLGRLVSASQCLVFFVLAFALLWRGTAWSVLGLLGALTPTTLFLSSVINPDGVELAANLAFIAGLLRLSDSGSTAPRWVWAGVGASGAVVVLAWHLGWVFVFVEAALVAMLVGVRQLRHLISDKRREAGATAIVLLAGLAVYLSWGLSVALLRGTFSLSAFGSGVQDGFAQLRVMLYGAVGLFGQLNVALPANGYYWVWWLLVLALFVGGLALASWRERGVMTLACVIALAYPVLLYAGLLRHAGFSLQPRYVMPLLSVVPLLGGELVFRSYKRLPSRVIRYVPSAAIALIGCYELMAWWVNARAAAGKPTVFWFLHAPYWAPPSGWVPWAATATVGAIVLLAGAQVEWVAARGLLVRPATSEEMRKQQPVAPPA
ncbi:MAG: DUF2142 domain-containing protein [Solirubrobacterales bacterium]|nr:DUF2142 domain-containing protein [Solirubrobacterales bacterium]